MVNQIARPSKATENLKYHATKAELAQRKAAEKASLSGLLIRESQEVAADECAHAEFLRVSELLSAVGKNDAMFEAVINDYCLYKSDIARYMRLRQEIEHAEHVGAQRYKLLLDYDKQIEAYRKKRFDIEKENGFTVASAMRAIPKKPVEQKNPLLEALSAE